MTLRLTIRAWHEAYANGLRPADMIDVVLERIATADDPGIFLSLYDRDRLMAAVNSLEPFDLGAKPLWGVPFAVKDNIDIEGLPTTAACPEFAYEPGTTAFAVARLLRAGAIAIGKTNLDQFATGLVGVRTPYPVPRNAVDPRLVPGGSSSGSAVAVARGIVPFALGTDTAGSGRVPAALNNIVGLKPSLGAVSTSGVVPACRTLDCVSVFALTADDAWRVYATMAGYDPSDPYSRQIATGVMAAPPRPRVAVPELVCRDFGGDAVAMAAFERSVTLVREAGGELSTFDLAPFRAVADLLYSGPWVAERYQAIRSFFETNEDAVYPVTRAIIAQARNHTAADTFAGLYKLAELKRATQSLWRSADMMLVPSIPTICDLETIAADPIGANTRLGTYTNFVNLLDLCAFAVPAPTRSDGRPAGVTLIAPSGRDGVIAAFAERLHALAGVPMGATGAAVPAPRPASLCRAPSGFHELVVVGAHMSGLALNHELTERGGIFLRNTTTMPSYRLFALPGTRPERPGLLRVAEGGGAAIAVEVWAVPAEGFASLVDAIPSPLGVGTIYLADGTLPRGFLVEAAGVTNAEDVTRFGGWRAYLAS